MNIGKLHVYNCPSCPAYRWNGYDATKGDQGYNCEFGAYTKRKVNDIEVSPECPLKLEVEKIPEPVSKDDKINPIVRLALEMGPLGEVRVKYELGGKVAISARHSSTNKVRSFTTQMDSIYYASVDLIKHGCVDLNNYFKHYLKPKVQAHVAPDTDISSPYPLIASMEDIKQGLVPPPPTVFNMDFAEAEKKIFAQATEEASTQLLDSWGKAYGKD